MKRLLLTSALLILLASCTTFVPPRKATEPTVVKLAEVVPISPIEQAEPILEPLEETPADETKVTEEVFFLDEEQMQEEPQDLPLEETVETIEEEPQPKPQSVVMTKYEPQEEEGRDSFLMVAGWVGIASAILTAIAFLIHRKRVVLSG